MEQLDFRKSADLIKGKLTLRQIMEHYGINLTGKRLIQCPFHEDSTASLQVSDVDSGDGFFYCHACTDKHGDLINFVAFEEGCSLSDAIILLSKRYSVDVQTKIDTNLLEGTISSILEPERNKAVSKFSQYVEASKNAQDVIKGLGGSRNLTPYMVNKKINHYGTFNRGTSLVVPLMDFGDTIWGVQYIYPNGGKSFLDNCRIDGCFLRLGPEPKITAYLAEGYATGASVYEASGVTTFVCFTAKNIKAVYEDLSSLLPKVDFIVTGDNDSAGHRHGLRAVYPPAGMDWNDLFCQSGKEAVANFLLPERVSKFVENPLVSKLENILNKGL